jgi:hypothetical protein
MSDLAESLKEAATAAIDGVKPTVARDGQPRRRRA